MEGLYELSLEVKYITSAHIALAQIQTSGHTRPSDVGKCVSSRKREWFAEERTSLCHKPLGLDFLKDRGGKGELNGSLLKMCSEIESRFKQSG